jgi:hypothetical protein
MRASAICGYAFIFVAVRDVLLQQLTYVSTNIISVLEYGRDFRVNSMLNCDICAKPCLRELVGSADSAADITCSQSMLTLSNIDNS